MVSEGRGRATRMVPSTPSWDTSQKRPAGEAGSAGKFRLENAPLNEGASKSLKVSPSARGLPLAVTRSTPPNLTDEAATKSLLKPEALLAISMMTVGQAARQSPIVKLLLIVSLPMERPGARMPADGIETESLITPSPANVPPWTKTDPLPDPIEPRTARVPWLTTVPP